MEVLQATEGSPRYCILLEVEEAQHQTVADRLRSMHQQYSGYISNPSVRTFKEVG